MRAASSARREIYHQELLNSRFIACHSTRKQSQRACPLFSFLDRESRVDCDSPAPETRVVGQPSSRASIAAEVSLPSSPWHSPSHIRLQSPDSSLRALVVLQKQSARPSRARFATGLAGWDQYWRLESALDFSPPLAEHHRFIATRH